jgi:hypothetical protein
MLLIKDPAICGEGSAGGCSHNQPIQTATNPRTQTLVPHDLTQNPKYAWNNVRRFLSQQRIPK